MKKVLLILACMIFLVSLVSALVSAATYYPNSTGSSAWIESGVNLGTALWGWQDCDLSVYSSANLNAVSVDSGSVDITGSMQGFGATKSCHRLKIKINENVSEIDKIDILVKQAVSIGTDVSISSLDLLAGNISSESWVKLASQASPVSDNIYTQSASLSPISSYIENTTTGNYIYLLLFSSGVYNNEMGSSLTHKNYFVKLDITIVTPPPENITPPSNITAPENITYGNCIYYYDEKSLLVKQCCYDLCENYEYDSIDRLIKIEGNYTTTTYSYNTNNLITSKTLIFKGYENSPYTINYEYTSNDYVSKIIRPESTEEYTYNGNNQIIKEEKTFSSGENEITSWDYDSGGRVICENCAEDATGSIIEYEYNNNSLVSSRTINFEEFTQTYNSDNRIEKVCKESQCANFAYTSTGELEETQDSGLYGQSFSYEYDSSGNLVYDSVTNTRYTYDASGNLISDGTYNYGYNNGKVISKKLASTGELIASFNYNPSGFISEVVYPDNSNDKYYYDLYGNIIMADIFGQTLFYITPENPQLMLTPDELGELTGAQAPVTGQGILGWIIKKLTGFVSFIKEQGREITGRIINLFR